MRKMIPGISFRLVFIVVQCVVLVKGDNHETYPRETQNLELLYGSTANMTCADSVFNPGQAGGARYQWVLPTGELLTHDSETHDGHYQLQNNGSTLLVIDVDKPDFGVYFCLVFLESDYTIHTAVKWGLNMDGPYYGDLTEKYSPRLRTGLYAGLVVFVVMSMFCFNYDAFQARHDKGGKPGRIDMEISMQPYMQSGKTRSDMEMEYTNPAYVKDQVTSDSDEPTNGVDGGKERVMTTARETEAEPQTHF